MNITAKIVYFAFSITALLSSSGFAQAFQGVKGHVHEAFMTIETEQNILLSAIAVEPPPPIDEKIPSKKDSQAIWVPGYWEWLPELNDFVWCSGSWRRPPPEHIWIKGRWQHFSSGWVRLRGFWSKKDTSELNFISMAPPASLNENPSSRPGENYFWMSGYWDYLPDQNDFNWLSGQWEQLDPNWVYVPAHYAWRPDGYIFIPAYWDWPIDMRGTAYACVQIPRRQRIFEYTPDIILEPMQIVEECLLYYPDYYYFYCHHYYFHIDWWWDYAWCPPWWAWDWWWFSWDDQWALWWWWTHPGFPIPVWLSDHIIAILFDPPNNLILAMQNIHAPLIITPLGVVSPDMLLDALAQSKGPNAPPIFPIDQNEIQNEAAENLEEEETLRPEGSKEPLSELNEDPQPLPQISPDLTLPTERAEQPTIPKPPSTVKRPSKPKKPSSRRTSRPPRRPSRPIRPPSQKIPERPSRPIQPPSRDDRPQIAPELPSQPPSQVYPPADVRPSPQPDIKPPSRPNLPQSYPDYRPIKPPQQTPELDRTPPQTYPPSQERPSKPQLQPEIQQIQPRQPQIQTYPSQPQQKPETYYPSKPMQPQSFPNYQPSRPQTSPPTFKPNQPQTYPSQPQQQYIPQQDSGQQNLKLKQFK